MALPVRSLGACVALCISCGGSAPAPTAVPGKDAAAAAPEPESDLAPEPDAPETALVEFSGWAQWTMVSAERFESDGHGHAFVDVYVPPEHAEIYSSKGEVPQGMRVVKAQYNNLEDTDPVRITVMAKREPGYDSERGDWYYGVFAADGTTFRQQGKLGSCSGCHNAVSGSDFLFRK
jgi:hypothetical protein